MRRKPAQTTVPFMGGEVTLREIGALDRVGLFDIVKTPDGERQNPQDVVRLNCALLAKSACDEAGNPLMDADEWLALCDSEMTAVLALGEASLDLNNMRGESIEVTAKN